MAAALLFLEVLLLLLQHIFLLESEVGVGRVALDTLVELLRAANVLGDPM